MKPIKTLLQQIVVASLCCMIPLWAHAFRFIALGDMPYRDGDETRFEQLIKSINRSQPTLSIFVGDTKNGSSPCSNEYLLKIHRLFNTFQQPLIYTPGDNEWTDCHRPSAGAFEPSERLQFIRQLYFSDTKSLGKNSIRLNRQADIHPRFKEFVENAYWVHESTLFVTVHVVGSNNNFSQFTEYTRRNQANLTWLEHIFTITKSQGIDHLVIALQADLFYSPEQATSLTSGLRDTIALLNQKLADFAKPALIIHGDSHRLIIDQPFSDPISKRTLDRAYRLQVMGDQQIEAVEITVDKTKQSPFSFRPFLIQP